MLCGPRASTHTFILYLSDCREGGETRLLKAIPSKMAGIGGDEEEEEDKEEGRGGSRSAKAQRRHRARLRRQKEAQHKLRIPSAQAQGQGDSHGIDPNVLVSVRPRRGRLLLFPHAAPHEGRPVVIRRLPEEQGQEQGGSCAAKLLLRGEAL